MLRAVLSNAGVHQVDCGTGEVWKALRAEFSIQNIIQGTAVVLMCFVHQTLPLEMVWETGDRTKMEALQLPFIPSLLSCCC